MMPYSKKISQIALMSAFALGITNCADKPTQLELVIKSGKHLNPNKNDIASPLILNLYELKDTEQFLKSDFWGLTDEPKKRLENVMTAHSKQIIIPNEEQKYQILLNENTSYFGVVCSFRNIENRGSWRYVKPLEKGFNHLELFVNDSSIKESTNGK